MTSRVATGTTRSTTIEQGLVERARAMDGDAWDEIYTAHHAAVFRYVYLRTGNGSTAEELSAEVFLQAVRGIRRYRHRGVPLRAWLYRIAHNLTVDHRKRHRKEETVELPDGFEESTGETDFAGQLVDRMALLSAMQRLTDDQQQVLILRFFQGLPLAAVAEATGRRPGAVKSLQHRALQRLRAILEEENYHVEHSS